MTDEFTGLIPDPPEVVAQLQSEAVPLPGSCYAQDREATYASPPPYIVKEDQGRMNSCAGNAATTAAEADIFWETGSYTQLSRLFCYAEGQKKAGIRGDSGCTLSGIIRALEDIGCCREIVVPYGPYRTQFDGTAYEDAANWRLKNKVSVRGGYQDVRALLGQKVGGILSASFWGLALDGNRYAKNYKPTGRGAHAWAMVALADSRDAQGRPDVWCANSHYNFWWFKASATFVDELIGRDQFGIMGLTSMTTVKGRINWLEREMIG